MDTSETLAVIGVLGGGIWLLGIVFWRWIIRRYCRMIEIVMPGHDPASARDAAIRHAWELGHRLLQVEQGLQDRRIRELGTSAPVDRYVARRTFLLEQYAHTVASRGQVDRWIRALREMSEHEYATRYGHLPPWHPGCGHYGCRVDGRWPCRCPEPQVQTETGRAA